MPKIFIVEDEENIRKELKTLLEKYGYECFTIQDFDDVAAKISVSGCDLVLLDINLPYFDGYHVCRELRKVSDVPVIVVTSRQSEIDELMSMNLGADDFVTKPYNVQIFLARISAVLRRRKGMADNSVISYKSVNLNISRGSVSFEDKEAELTKNELRILQLLMKNKGSIISRDEIMEELWQSDEFVDDNTLTVNINRLRRKLKEIGVEEFLITKRGQGYLV